MREQYSLPGLLASFTQFCPSLFFAGLLSNIMASCFIYALKTRDHVHYVGSTFNVRARGKAHRTSKRLDIRELIQSGAQIETLLVCEPSEGYRMERAAIVKLRRQGQCELNLRLPSRNRSCRSLSSETALCGPVQTPDGKTVFKSKSDAARCLDISFATIGNMVKRGELIRSR